MIDKKYKNILRKPTLLLHSCCGPCSTSVLLRLIEDFEVTVLFYNPNIDTKSEFDKRFITQEEVIKYYLKENNLSIDLISDTYQHDYFLKKIKGLENEVEGGLRCNECIELRLDRTAKIASKKNYEYFTTTLSVSPHKNSKLINSLGEELAKKYNVKFLESDFKKKDGFLISTMMSKKLNLYRQNYCGCEFAKSHLNINK